MILKILTYIFYIPIWFLTKLLPRDSNIWVFGAWFGERYSDNAKELFEYIINNNKTVDAVWITRNKTIHDKLNEKNIKCHMVSSFKGIITCLKAKFFIFSSTKFDINPFLMNGAIKIQTWHGAPMKKIGLDNIFLKDKLKKIQLVKLFFPFLYEFNYDYVVSSSSFFNKFLCSAFNLKKNQIITSGYPRNDVFFNERKSNYLKYLNKKYRNPKIICYLPTFRDNEPNIDLFFQFGFNLNSWENFLEKTNSLLVLKPHYASDNFVREITSERIIFLGDEDEPDLNLFLKDAHVLITDYSGAYFDFKLTSKQIILAPFDLDKYISFSRELYIDYNVLDDPKCSDWNEILMLLNNKKSFKPTKSKSKFNDFYDGYSSQRLFNFIQKINN